MIDGLVSTVIPVFNRPAMLREAVDSVLAQTWRPIEIVIVDDGSTDATAVVAESLRAENPSVVKLLAQANAGPGVARQHGLTHSTGEFVQFLDSDDLLLPKKFSLQIAGLREDTAAGISYGKSYASTGGVRSDKPAQRTGEVFRTLFPALLREPIWPTMTPLYRRALIDRIGPWPRARQLEDWIYDAQAAELGVELHYVDDYIAETRDHTEARLCREWMSNPEGMKERIAAYFEVMIRAKRAGVERVHPEYQRFARSLFWMARNAGRYGLESEAERLFLAAREETLAPGWDYRCFGIMAKLLGWSRVSRLAEGIKGLTR